MKTVKKDASVKKLPPHHVAVLFEGPWLMTQDPDDPTRVLAMCPYTNDPDHICQRGLWSDDTEALVGMALTKQGLPNVKGKPGLVREGERFWIDVTGRRKGTRPTSVVDLFRKAATGCQDYPFVFLQDDAEKLPMNINHTNPLMRRVSIAMPDFVKPAGRIMNATVQPGKSKFMIVNATDYLYKAGSEADCCSYVAFAFIYNLQKTGALTMQSPSLPSSGPISVPVSKGYNPHLIFRVHGGNVAEPDGCPSDTSGENRHVVASFDLLRKLVTKQATSTADAFHIDVGIYPSPAPADPDETDADFSPAELGVASEGKLSVVFKDLASCAAGPIFGDGGDGNG